MSKDLVFLIIIVNRLLFSFLNKTPSDKAVRIMKKYKPPQGMIYEIHYLGVYETTVIRNIMKYLSFSEV